MNLATAVRYEEAFMMIGGVADVGNSAKNLDTVLKYQPETDTWVELASKMRIGRYNTIALVVDEAIFQVC